MKKDEAYFQKEFLNFYKNHPFFKGSFMSREIPQFYSFDSPKRKKDYFMPFSVTDFIEIDADGNFHLWEAKLLHSDELIKGKAVGQLIFYDFLFSTYPETELKELLIKTGFDKEIINKFSFENFNFKTWNILVCGGQGWEISAGVNPIMWNYPSLKESYFQENSPELNVFHFYEVNEGYDLKNIWELSILNPRDLHPDAMCRYLGIDSLPQDEEELNRLYLDIVNNEMSIESTDLEILEEYGKLGEEVNNDFLNKYDIDKDYLNNLISVFDDNLKRLFKNEDEELEMHEHFNRFIGREWFKNTANNGYKA
jgi:hypothetical protein